MSRSQESGAYLGGIGAMLQVSHCCPACGQVHEGRKYGFKHRAPRECPLVIMGSFPVVSLPSPPAEAPLKVPSIVREGNGDVSRVSPTVLAEPIPQLTVTRGRDAERNRGLGTPWLPPPDLGEVL